MRNQEHGELAVITKRTHMIGGSHHPGSPSAKQIAPTHKQRISSNMKTTQLKTGSTTIAGRRGEPHPENLRYGYLLPGQVRHSREAQHERVRALMKWNTSKEAPSIPAEDELQAQHVQKASNRNPPFHFLTSKTPNPAPPYGFLIQAWPVAHNHSNPHVSFVPDSCCFFFFFFFCPALIPNDS